MSLKSYIVPSAVILFGIAWVGVSTARDKEPLRMDHAHSHSHSHQVVVQGDWCMEAEPDRSRGWYCEVREIEFSPGDINGIDAGPNGGIEVTGWGDNSVLVLARVQGKARSDGDARDLVEEVRIESGGITLRARGPRTQRRESWSVSYRVSVPHRYDLDLSTVNGGISVTDVNGHIEFSATNGGVSLVEVGGDVRGRTTNGGLKIQLSGDRWDGEGLDVRTTNGGITMILPEEFNAQLESGTTHGGISIDFPVTVSGRIERRLITQLGSGGPLVRAITTNGGVRITKR